MYSRINNNYIRFKDDVIYVSDGTFLSRLWIIIEKVVKHTQDTIVFQIYTKAIIALMYNSRCITYKYIFIYSVSYKFDIYSKVDSQNVIQ